MAVHGWNLHRELPARPETREEARNEARMIVNPVQGRMGEDQIPLALEFFDLALFETQSGAQMRACLAKHFGGAIQAEHVAFRQAVGEFAGEFPGAATQVDNFHSRTDLNQREQVLEGESPLLLKFVVEFRIPGHGMAFR